MSKPTLVQCVDTSQGVPAYLTEVARGFSRASEYGYLLHVCKLCKYCLEGTLSSFFVDSLVSSQF